MVASERPTALDGGADEAVRYAPGDAASFVSALAGALGAEGYDNEGPFKEEATAIAQVLRDAPDQAIIWGERLWRDPEAVEALLACARVCDMHQRIGPGLLEVPEESNGRGLREVGCLPGARAGLEPTDAGRGSAGIKDGLAAHELGAVLLVNADPVRTHPDSDGWRQALAGNFVVAIASFEDESTRLANIVIPAETCAEKEGTVTHPDGRLQRLRRNVPLPEGMIPGWRFLAAVAEELGIGVERRVTGRRLRRALRRGPVLRLADLRGDRRARGCAGRDRDPGQSWTPPGGPPASTSLPAREDEGEGLLLGTYRDLWAADVTKRNPALRFLMPNQKLELAANDAEQLELAHGDDVTVAVNGHSVEATVAIRERMRRGRRLPDRGDRRGQRERAHQRRPAANPR